MQPEPFWTLPRVGVIIFLHFKLFNIVEDGKIGAKTLQAVNQIKPDQLLSVLKKECEDFYTNLATKNPELKKFLNGWLKRADS